MQTTVNSTIQSASSVWKGPDVSKFQADWHSHQAALGRVGAIGEVEQLLGRGAQALARGQALGCGHGHLRMSGMLTTSAATHRVEVSAGAQGPMPQIVCPDSRSGGDALSSWRVVYCCGHYPPTLNLP